ncbi:MAG TPA: hypothetical protein VGE52_18990, partial [Pirellulales bacterium]
EVLVSCAILVVGLLSLAALIPVGIFQSAQAARADAASAVGRAAWRTIKVADLLRDRSTYVDTATNSYSTVGRYVYVQSGSDAGAPGFVPFPVARVMETGGDGGAYAGAFVIDPYGLAATNGTSLSVGAGNTAMGSFPPNSNPADGLGLPRVTLRRRFPDGTPLASLPSVGGALLGENARRMFTSSSDPVFDYQVAKGDLARPMRGISPGAGGILDETSSLHFDGHYSWMITASPVFGEPSPMASTTLADDLTTKLFSVSVVVFYRRPSPPDAAETPSFYSTSQEARAEVEFSDGVSDVYGRDIQLRWPSITDLDAIPKLRPKDWVMLYGRVADNGSDALDSSSGTPSSVGDANINLATSADAFQYFPISPALTATATSGPANAFFQPGATTPTARPVFKSSVMLAKWCQVVASDPAEVATTGTGCTQRLSLRASDFDLIRGVRTASGGVTPVDFGTNRPGFFAATCAGVVGVFEKTIRLE